MAGPWKRIRASTAWVGGATLVLAFAALACGAAMSSSRKWSEKEVETIHSLSLAELEPLAPDPTNRFGDDTAAVRLGHALFFDTRLSGNGKVSCATCHQPGRQFQDDVPVAVGMARGTRRTMPITGTAHGAWFFWDGRKDSQWAQALGPLENPVEHGGTRAQYAHVVSEHYRADYERVFGPLPDLTRVPRNAGPVADSAARGAWEALTSQDRESVSRVYANLGKAIAAYERRMEPGTSRFDRYAEALGKDGRPPEGILTPQEEAGLKLFIGKANCTQCHNGPLFTDDHFHNTGVSAVAALLGDVGRSLGAKQVLEDEFNCRSRYSDAKPGECAELEFLKPDGEELTRAYKPPSLRGVAERAPYMHAGQIATLGQVIEHYNRAPAAPSGHSEIHPLHLSPEERAQLESYLHTLDAPVNAARWLLEPPHHPK